MSNETDHDRLLRANLMRVFNERDAALREAAIAELFVTDPVMYEPDNVVEGREAISAVAGHLLEQFGPRFRFSPAAPRGGPSRARRAAVGGRARGWARRRHRIGCSGDRRQPDRPPLGAVGSAGQLKAGSTRSRQPALAGHSVGRFRQESRARSRSKATTLLCRALTDLRLGEMPTLVLRSAARHARLYGVHDKGDDACRVGNG